MLRYILSIALTYSLLACSNKEAVYTNEECKFSIAFPKEPKKEVLDYEEPFKYQLKSFICFSDSTSGDLNLSYEVRYTEVPKGILDKLSNEEIHNQMFGMLGNVSDHPEMLAEKKYWMEMIIFVKNMKYWGVIKSMDI